MSVHWCICAFEKNATIFYTLVDTDLKKDIKVEEDIFGKDKGINGNKSGNSYDQGTFYVYCTKTSQ